MNRIPSSSINEEIIVKRKMGSPGALFFGELLAKDCVWVCGVVKRATPSSCDEKGEEREKAERTTTTKALSRTINIEVRSGKVTSETTYYNNNKHNAVRLRTRFHASRFSIQRSDS
jgi:hypothetical protein